MTQELVFDRRLESDKQLVRLLYIVHGLTFFFSLGLLSFLPLIVNYVKRSDTDDMVLRSHHTWMIRSFWIYIICLAAAWILAVTVIGIPLALLIFGVAWLWKAYRLIKGFVDLNSGRSMPV